MSTLQTRKKWSKKIQNIKVNDIVLIKEDNLPPCRWFLVKIVATKSERDGLVRVASIKTKTGIVDRTIRKLIIFLPDENSKT